MIFEMTIFRSKVKGQRSRTKVKGQGHQRSRSKHLVSKGTQIQAKKNVFMLTNTSPRHFYPRVPKPTPPPYPLHTHKHSKTYSKSMFLDWIDHFQWKLHVFSQIFTKKMPKLIFYCFIWFFIKAYNFIPRKWIKNPNWSSLVNVVIKKHLHMLSVL